METIKPLQVPGAAAGAPWNEKGATGVGVAVALVELEELPNWNIGLGVAAEEPKLNPPVPTEGGDDIAEKENGVEAWVVDVEAVTFDPKVVAAEAEPKAGVADGVDPKAGAADDVDPKAWVADGVDPKAGGVVWADPNPAGEPNDGVVPVEPKPPEPNEEVEAEIQEKGEELLWFYSDARKTKYMRCINDLLEPKHGVGCAAAFWVSVVGATEVKEGGLTPNADWLDPKAGWLAPNDADDPNTGADNADAPEENAGVTAVPKDGDVAAVVVGAEDDEAPKSDGVGEVKAPVDPKPARII